MVEYFIEERLPGAAYTTYTDRAGEVQRVPLAATTIGPFTSIPAAADYLAEKAILHADYAIKTVRRVAPPVA